MTYTSFKIELNNDITVLTITRPESLNALNSLFFKEMNLYLDSIKNAPSTKALIITGAGKAFVAGADIAEMQNMGKDESFKFSKTGQNTFSRLENLDIPVIAAVNGYALGGGCELALACDFRFGSTFAKFGLPEVSLGLIPGYGATQRLSRLIGQGNALFLQLSGQMIDSEEALRMGIIQKLFPPEELINQTLEIAKKIINQGPNAIKALKKVVRQGLELDLQKAMDLESTEFSKLFESDGPEGMKAFLEKRKPIWK